MRVSFPGGYGRVYRVSCKTFLGCMGFRVLRAAEVVGLQSVRFMQGSSSGLQRNKGMESRQGFGPEALTPAFM